MKQILIKSVLLMCTISIKAEAQTISKSIMAASGNSVVTSGTQVDWTAGQTRIGSHAAGNYVITEGFHPIYDVATSIQALAANSAGVQLYPNPVDDKLYVEIKDAPQGTSLLIKDVLGKTVVMRNNIPRGFAQAEINFADKPSGIYFVELRYEKQLLYTSKIVKR
jgi:hypothetical protein